MVLAITKGLAGSETSDAHARALALAEKAGNSSQMHQLLEVAAAKAHASGNYARALELADQILNLARREKQPKFLAFAHFAQMVTRLYLGDLAGAEEHVQLGKTFLSARELLDIPGRAASTVCHAGWTAWISGRADEARERFRLAIDLAREKKSDYDIAWAQYMASYLELWLGNTAAAEAAALESLAASQAAGSPLWRAMSRVSLGWARSRLGQIQEGIELIQNGMDGLIEVGSDVKVRDYQALAHAQYLAGSITDALATIDKALATNPEELWMRPETYRLRGEFRLQQEQVEAAEADFREAVGLARNMGAKMLELRATTSLSRLLRDTNRRDEARTMLADIYNWFTEGFDTADLKDAKALLDELSG